MPFNGLESLSWFRSRTHHTLSPMLARCAHPLQCISHKGSALYFRQDKGNVDHRNADRRGSHDVRAPCFKGRTRGERSSINVLTSRPTCLRAIHISSHLSDLYSPPPSPFPVRSKPPTKCLVAKLRQSRERPSLRGSGLRNVRPTSPHLRRPPRQKNSGAQG
jgi:hypothetical protein